MMKRLCLLSALPLTALLFVGCLPHQIENQVQEMLPPPDYKPVYMTSSVPFSTIVEQYRKQIDLAAARGTRGGESGAPGDRAPESGSTAAGTNIPLAMDIRNVNDSRYPNEVELRAFVYDTSGRFVMGLAPPHFAGQGNYRDYWRTLVDSCRGAAVAIDSFDVVEVRQDRREPYALAFVLDHSPSMTEPVTRRLQEAVKKVLRVIKPGDEIAAIKFTSSMKIEVPLTSDSATFKNAFLVDGLRGYGGGTALYDAALTGIREVSKSPESFKRAIILFSDGGDNSSDSTMEAVHRLAKEKHVSIYTVAYGLADEETMRNLAAYSGGRFYRMYSQREFIYVFADIYRSLNNYYRITYRPPQCDGVHTARASLVIPELNSSALVDDGIYDRSIFTPFDPVGTVAFVNIEFDYDKATIRPESMSEIQKVADAMLANPKIGLEVRGHTDDQGSEEYNQRLSEKRAEAVLETLVAMGVPRRRLTASGFGESQPLVPNDSDENRRKNRRTEFVIISK